MNGKIGIVTGGASGIGEAIVRRLLADGAKVHAVDRNAEALERLARDLPGQPLTTVVGDIATPDVPARIVDDYAAVNGAPDFLVNAAGIVHESVPLHDLSVESFDKIFTVNSRGTFLFYQAVIHQMMKAGKGGSIVNISSTAGIRPIPLAAAYVGSKHAVVGFTTTAALEVAPHGIRVNAICPGVIDTPLFRANSTEGAAVSQLIGAIPIRRLGQPSETAAAVAWLLGDDASYVTGVVLPIDGGLSLI